MFNLELSDSLLQQIEAAGFTGSAVDGFVQQAIREKLNDEERRKEFHKLTGRIRESMLVKGLTEDELLDDFEKHRLPKRLETP